MSPARLVILLVVVGAAAFGVYTALRAGNPLLALLLGVIVGGVIALTREAGDRGGKNP